MTKTITKRIDGTVYKARRVETGSEMWGGYEALRVLDAWRFLVTIRGTHCVVVVTGRTAEVYEGESVHLVKSLVAYTERERYHSNVLCTARKLEPEASCVLRALQKADAILAPIWAA